MHDKRSAFTLFELLAVLTITGIILMVILGSYNSWSSIQACNGTANVLKSGMLQARVLAQSKNRYVAFEFGTISSNQMQQVSGFQIYICTNETGNIEQQLQNLQDLNQSATVDEINSAVTALPLTYAAPYQRLSNQITLFAASTLAGFDLANSEEGAILFFRPDGSVWSGNDNVHSHYAGVYTRKLYHKAPMIRLLRIDLATGAIVTIKGEDLNATQAP